MAHHTAVPSGRHEMSREERKVLAGTLVGTTIEWYDFFIHAQAAACVLAPLFFEPLNQENAGLAQVVAQGWRIPFLSSVVLIVVGCLIRKTVDEPPVFQEMQLRKKESSAPLGQLFKYNSKEVTLAALIFAANNAAGYLVIAFFASYGATVLGMPRSQTLIASLIGGVGWLVFTMFGGWISDRIGRVRTIQIGYGIINLWAVPMWFLLDTASLLLNGTGMSWTTGVYIAGLALVSFIAVSVVPKNIQEIDLHVQDVRQDYVAEHPEAADLLPPAVPATVSTAVADVLAERTDHLFGLMGNGNAHPISSLTSCGFGFTSARHEAATVAMADAYHRATGRVGAATTTYGAGVTGRIPAADPERTWRGSAPEVATAGFRSPDPVEDPAEFGPDGRLDPRAVVAALEHVLPADRSVVMDGGHFIGWAPVYLSVPDPQAMLLVGTAFQSIGLGFGSAAGVSVARPERTTVFVTGDGGGLMGLAEFETFLRATRRGVVVVLNDSADGAELHQYAFQGLDPTAMLIDEVDFAAIGRALGAAGTKARCLADLTVLQDWLDGHQEGVFVLDVAISQKVVAEFMTASLTAGRRLQPHPGTGCD